MKEFWSRLKAAVCKVLSWGDRRVPRGLRSCLGVLLILGGFLGFLPILGFWMVPAGVVMIGLDVPPLRRRIRAYLDRHERQQ